MSRELQSDSQLKCRLRLVKEKKQTFECAQFLAPHYQVSHSRTTIIFGPKSEQFRLLVEAPPDIFSDESAIINPEVHRDRRYFSAYTKLTPQSIPWFFFSAH